jgi:ribosomal protein S18 acetylase RimI-like enzyme
MFITLERFIEEKYIKKFNLEKISKKKKKIYAKYKNDFDKKKFISKFANNINEGFIEKVIKDRKNKFLLYCLDNNTIDYNHICSIVIYRKVMDYKDKVRYVIFILAVKPTLRGNGYGKLTLNNLLLNLNKKKMNEIVLHSIKSSYGFYIKNGFIEIHKNYFIEKYEGIHDNFILMKIIF